MVRMKAAKACEQPLEDLELIERLEDEIDVREARKALADKSPSVPWEQVKRELGL